MINKTLIVIIVFLFAGNINAQRITDNNSNFKMKEISEKLLNDTLREDTKTD